MSQFRQQKRNAFVRKFNVATAVDVTPANKAQDEKGQEVMRARRERMAADPEYRAQQRLKIIFGGSRRSKKKIRMPEFGGSDGSS